MAAGAAVLIPRATSRPSIDGRRAFSLERAVLPGDVVFRSCLSIESAAVLAARARSRFSHVGIAVRSDSQMCVVHALPADRRSPGGVLLSPWETFATAPDVSAISAFRVAGISATERGRIVASSLRLLGVPFNADLALETDKGVYCTQLALLALSAADPSILRFVHPTTVGILPTPVILPDSLLDWPRLVELAV
jgi:hypothetical protein